MTRDRLLGIGFWDDPDRPSGLPDVSRFVDNTWSLEERELVAEYLETGIACRFQMGISKCRFCRIDNGSYELTDGKFVWPVGLSHYIRVHGVRPPTQLVEYILQTSEFFSTCPTETDWWKSICS